MTNKIDEVDLWESSGLIDRHGNLGRPLVDQGVAVPGILRLDEENDLLLWWYDDLSSFARYVYPKADALEKFVRLAEKPATRILEYARNYGVLQVCRHNLPVSHNPRPEYPQSRKGSRYGCSPESIVYENDVLFSEPFQVWRTFSREARAMLNLAAHLHRGEVGPIEAWETLPSQASGPNPRADVIEYFKSSPVDALISARSLFASHVGRWLSLGNVRPRFAWPPFTSSPFITLAGDSLFTALAIQLTLAVSRSDGFVICSACGQPFTPSRRGKKDQRRYCDECRENKKPQRDAASDYRRRKKGASVL